MSEPIHVSTGLIVDNGAPIDVRLVLTKAQMLAMPKMKMPRDGDGSGVKKYFCLCIDDNQLYIYDMDAELDPETGRFRSASSLNIASTTVAGTVKSTTAVNGINVLNTGIMEVNQIGTSKLVNETGNTLTIDGGDATTT